MTHAHDAPQPGADQASLVAELDGEVAAALQRLREAARIPSPSCEARARQAAEQAAETVALAEAVFSDHAGRVTRREPMTDADSLRDALTVLSGLQSFLDGLVARLLIAARTNTADGTPLLTFDALAEALGLRNAEVAQALYVARIGIPDLPSAGLGHKRRRLQDKD
ncbi:MAG TPA: hypothetical protein VLH10_15125 [Yinghuangia sp.]|nr:hypothetical protein [Yinghuangia sp.]